MDYIHGLFIAEDDLDGDENESTNLAPSSTVEELTPFETATASPEPGPSHAASSSPSWCRGFNSSWVAGRSTRLQRADYPLGAFTQTSSKTR